MNVSVIVATKVEKNEYYFFKCANNSNYYYQEAHIFWKWNKYDK